MPKLSAASDRLYVYAIASDLDGANFGPIGLDGRSVYAMTSGGVTAVVSRAPVELRPERRQLAAHHAVLQHVVAEADAVLPVAFGIVAGNRDAVCRMLARNRREIVDTLRRLTRRLEMGLRITWDVPNIFEYFVSTHAELQAARDWFFAGNREPSQGDKIELGRLFDRLLAESRERHADQVEATLRDHCAEIKRTRLRNEHDAVSLACLVDRDRHGDFEAAVFDAARGFDNNFAFDYGGPWPPYNFVGMTLDLGPARPPAHAVA